MRLEKTGRLAVLATILFAASLFTQQGESQAQAQVGGMSPALQAAATMFIPLPNSTLFTPDLVQQVQQLHTKDRWRLPEAKAWKSVAEDPYVVTRRLDEMWHTVGPWESKYKLINKYRGRISRLQELNPDVDFDNLQEGQQILVWKRSEEGVSRSLGTANRGRLVNGEPLPPGETYKIQYPHRAFGTYYAVSETVRVLDEFGERFPDAHPLLVGDMSFRIGRKIAPHKSHQSGRDVDITLPRKTPPPDYRRFHHLRYKDIDLEQTFWLVKQFVDSGHVEYIFLDKRWQRRLRNYAEEQGAPQEWLDKVFEYRSSRPGLAMIRHERGHHRHIHVRYRCQETDRRCS
ncbi:hypothetical protein FRD01_06245 [Microvenator marinus]|jgi:murein endopeptidase|uniref:LysM domain-containing protein n=1 Tax=Microvenator marinus TaxID=2600177 RepID=A0A5B8XT74_9DELT|nr:penicillin-insensitive murein endopeptidase [Microvenator marinus]QED26846.1 hypothetical protein FRD01_06245 [Microvenator marinus]